MTDRQIRIAYLVKHLRFKYKDKPELNAQLDRILWYSYPVVYPNEEIDRRLIQKGMDSRKRQKRRTRNYLNTMVEVYGHTLHFVTLTFRDDVLSNTSERTRHRYVASFLNEHCLCYYANIDYGAQNEREHYHAVVKLRGDSLPVFPYGFSNCKPISSAKKRNGDIGSIATYMNKLISHANKATTGKAFRSRWMEFDPEAELPF